MANYEDVIEKNKRYLNQAQIDALVAASKQYNIENAGNRAGALASAREQFDAGYRGLQNMGLAGATVSQPTSGEIPRLIQQVRTPVDDYNRRLQDVENRRLNALGGQFAQQTQAAWAAQAQREAEARERARQETMRQQQQRAEQRQQQQRAEQLVRINNRNTLPSSPKITVADLTTPSVKEFDEPKTPTAAERAAQKYQQDGLKRTAAVAQQAALNAAAELLGVTGPNNMKQAEQVRLDREAATARNVQNKVTQATKPILNQKTGDQYTYDTYTEAKEMQRAADDIAAKATRAARANKTNDTTEQDKKALKEASDRLENMKWQRHYGGKSAVSDEDYNAAQTAYNMAKLKVEQPEKYAARLVLSDPTKRGTTAWTKATHLMAPELADNVLESMGIRKPTMTDEQFTTDMQMVKDVRRSLDVIDSLRQEQENKKKTGTTGSIDYDQQFIDEELATLKELGYTEEQARVLVKRVSNERQTRSEYEYYQKALETEFKNDGLVPTKPVNQSETDTTYRLANNLPSMNLVAKTDYEALATAPAGPAEYMNDKQRNTYNALYETEGIEAANKYVEDISPILNLQRANDDQLYRQEMVNKNAGSAIWQNILSVGTNLIGNVPAMLEKLAISGYNAIANPDVPVYIDQNSGLSQLSNRTNYIREATSEKILTAHPNTWGKVANFLYQSGMSMADSAAAMAVAGVLGNTHAVDALFFSSAGNEAYRDARERGATQDQAMGFAVLSGAAEAIFEHVSVETFADQFIRENAKARRSTIAKLLIQSGTEASEEVTTEIADKLADAWVMGDKSDFNLKVSELMRGGNMSKEEATKQAFMDALKDVGMAGLGGLVSGLGFGLTGAIATKKSETKTGKAVKENGKLDRLTRAAKLFGGDVAQQAAEVEAGKQSDAQVGSLLHELQLAQNEALGIDAESNEQMTEAQAEELAKKGEALDVIMEGEQITADDAQKVIDTLGADKLAKMGYDASSADAFAKSYNEALESKSIKPISEVNKAEREFAQGKAVEELREESFERVYRNPKQGLAYEYEGKTVTPLPGNLTAVSFAEQERNNFKARTTATTGNVTYAFSGMQAREGMSNEQTLAEMQKALTKEARNKAEVYSKLASALGIKMTIHDVMTGTNGFIDESGNMHVVLSGKQSVLRVAAHELTHWMKANNGTGYASLRNHLVNEVGADRFDRMLKQKAREYGIDTSTEKGRAVADDEVCAELCERMLSNEEALEKFAEKDTEAAKSLKDRLLKILNAIKQALKSVKNRDFGESWSDLIREQETIESWVSGLQQAIENADKRANTNEGYIASVAGVTTVEQQEMLDEIRDLYMDKETARKQSLKQAAEESGKKKTYVRGYSAKEVESVISSGLLGDKSNYEGDDYENARGMIAQLIPDIAAALNGKADLEEVNDKVKAAVGAMYDNYFEDNGDMVSLRDKIPTVIAVDNTAKTDLTDEKLFGMSAKLSKALGRKVTLISKASKQFKNAAQLADVWEDVRDSYGLSDKDDFSVDIPKLLEFIQRQADTRMTAKEVFGSSLQNEIDTTAANIIEAVASVLDDKVDDIIAEHSVDVIEYDMAGYAEDLFKAGMSQNDITVLFDTMNKAIDKVKAHRAILDYGAELSTEEEVIEAKKNRAYLPYKQNADPHYKLALDFSTLCRKRVLLQTIQERLQARMGRATTQEETVAIRLALQKLQREGYKVEVACALCYVEAARLKSPKVINAFLNNTANEMRNYFAKKNPESKAIIEGLQQQWKVDHGLAPDATKNDMKAAGVNVTEYNNYSRDLREQFEGNDSEETIVARALDLVKNHRNVFLSASELTKLKKSDPDIFSAFTDKVRSATRSKAQETDTFYSRGDINMVTEAILNYANAESGFRHQSWSDFVPTHLLDTMAAVIEMSTRKAKMHAYTKVPAMVRLLGKTGMALNMSLIPSGNTGIDASGNLSFDSVEGMPWEVMMELRDMFPETAGNIAIGINGEQIQKLLASKDIDYVIPYHASGMNKNMRGYLDIRAWSEYTSSQNEKTNHRGQKGKAPELAEWFDEKAAAKATDGEAFMREASEKYLQLCYERNLTPKFAQYLQNNGDGSYSLKEGYENYWKMLTDRKMVNQQTGKVIIQQAVKPTFDQDTVLGILEDRLNDPAIQDAERAADIVTEQFSGWRADRNNADAEAIQAAKDLRDRTAAITAQKTAEAGGVRNSLDTDYMRLAEKQKSGTLTKEDESKLRKMVDDAAKAAGYTIKAFHGSRAIFNEFSNEMRGSNTKTQAAEKWHFAADYETANSYYPAGVMRELIKQHPSMFSQKDLDSMNRRGVSGKLYPLYLKMRNPLVVDVAGYDYESHKENKDAMMEYVEQADREVRDGIILTHVRDNNLRPEAEESTDYLFRSSSQAKLADLVTYDSNGNIIPLSDRFRTDRTGDEAWKNEDIRYSIDTDYLRLAEKYKSGTATETETKSLQSVVEQAAEAAMPNSVARGKDGKLMKFFHGTKAEFTKFERSKIGSTGRFEGSGFNFTPYEGRARSYGGRVLEGYLNIQHPLSADKKTFSVAKLAQLIRNIDPTGDNIIANYARNTNDYGTPSFIRRESMTTARALLEYNESDVDVYSDLSSADPDAESLIRAFSDMGYDGLIHYDSNGNIKTAVAFSSEQFKLADPVTYDDDGNIIPLSERFNTQKEDIRYSLDTDAIRQAFTVIDTEGIEDGLEALKGVKHVGMFALKDISRMLDASAGKNKGLRNTLHAIFEKPHSEATGRYARGVERMQERVMDIAKRAGVVDAKGKHFDSKKSAAIQSIGEGFSNTYTDLKLKVKDADHVTVKAYEPGTENLVVSENDYTLKELRKAYGTNAADYVWSQVFDKTQKAQESGKQAGWVEEMVNTRPYTLADLQEAFPNEWQQLKRAADEFRDMYDEYIRDQNNMLATIYPTESEFDSEDRVQKAIDKKQERLEQHKTAVNVQLDNLQKRLEAKEQEMAGKKRTDTKAFRDLVEQANRIGDQIASVKSEIAEYEANVKEELVKLAALKAEYQNARQRGELDSLSRMHRLQYRSDYFHHFTEMASGIQNLRAIFTNNTDISPKIVGRSENTKAKARWAGYFQERMGGDYTADAINGMLKYGQLAEYKLAFDPLTAYLRDVNKAIRNLDDNTNRDGLIRYIDQWADAIAGKSHKLDRNISDLGMAPRKAMQILNWINSRVIQNTLLFNARSALIQISNITNAKGIVKNNLDWLNGLRSWALAAKGDEAMAGIMAQSNFLASRYMDNLQLTDSKLKSAKAFGGWMLGALDEISAKATWWAAYQQYTRNPNAAKNQYRTYDNAIDYADDVTRRTHAGRGVGELAPAMTSRVINFVAPFQVEVNNTFQLLKDNVKQGNYLGILSTGLSVFLFNALFEGIVGSSPLQFDFIRAVLDIVLGFAQDDPDDDKDDYGILQAWQRLSGEAFGSLPYAGQLASIIGEDTAKKLFGTDNDATRYGNTQIGVNAVINAGKGVKDIATGLVEGRKVNWVDDLDDLLNLTLPFGAKQLTRTIEGVRTVAKGYEGKYDKEGKEQVHFATDGDILEAIHSALFGKWALTEASEYFGEKRLLPQLFGEYNGPKSSIGKAVDAKEYKAALQTGIDGKEYFTLKSDLSKYSTQPGKRAEMMQQKLTPEQKAKLDALMFGSKDAEMKAEGAVVYQKSSDGDWKVKADYTNQDLFDLSQAGDKAYTGTLEAMEKTGLPQDQAALAASMWDEAKKADDSKAAFRDMLRDNKNLTVEQKEALDLQYTGNKYPADYSDPDLYDLSVTNRTVYEKAKEAKAQGIPVQNYVGLYKKKQEYSGENQADYMRQEIMDSNLSTKQKELLDDLLVSDKGQNPDYSSPAWFEISMMGRGQYEEAKKGTKVGMTPETYLQVYKKWKTLDAKDENGKTVNGLKKKRAKEYMDSLNVSAPVYDYIWTAVFGYKSR